MQILGFAKTKLFILQIDTHKTITKKTLPYFSTNFHKSQYNNTLQSVLSFSSSNNTTMFNRGT